MSGLDKNQDPTFFLLFSEKISQKYLVFRKIVVPLHPLSLRNWGGQARKEFFDSNYIKQRRSSTRSERRDSLG